MKPKVNFNKHKRNLNFYIGFGILLLFSTVILIHNEINKDPCITVFNRLENKNSEVTGNDSLESPFMSGWVNQGTIVCSANNNQNDVQLISDGSGGTIIAWVDGRSGKNIYAQKIDFEGNLMWMLDGVPICMAPNRQDDIIMCSDGAGGAIIAWEDHRNVYWEDFTDIYVQRINSSGVVQWTTDGVSICEIQDRYVDYLQICSDGAGGAIITWEDNRNIMPSDIYAQRIDSSGNVQWTTNGIPICTEIQSQYWPSICSDDSGGAIITWTDYRASGYPNNGDIYAQRISSSGNIQWTPNGTAIVANTGSQSDSKIISNGAGGAIIAWIGNSDVYAQRIDSNGNKLWSPQGVAICTHAWNQHYVQLCTDGASGAILCWEDSRGIFAQRVSSSGTLRWRTNGIPISTVNDIFMERFEPQISSDGLGGAIITWEEGEVPHDIYAQRVNSNGNILWHVGGTGVCIDTSLQANPQICNNGAGGAIIAWVDSRLPSATDIFAFRIKSSIPTIDHPDDIKTALSRTETIIWTISDDFDGGEYRVLANNTLGTMYTWIDWTTWTKDTTLSIPIDRSTLGLFQYSIEYNDSDNQFGIPDNVIVEVKEDLIPTSNHPGFVTAIMGGSNTINWILRDDFGEGEYRVLANDTNGEFYTWIDWTSWINNTQLDVPINDSNVGIFNYTIEYTDDMNQYGAPDTVLIDLIEIVEPQVSINYPKNYEYFSILSPNYNISIVESNLDKFWYTIDGGITNKTITQMSGVISQTEWNKKANGVVVLTFYASDIFGNTGYSTTQIVKDTIEPEITINNPVQDDQFGNNAPYYDISIVEPNLEVIWYTINDGNINYTITQLIGTIDQEAWDVAPYGSITVRFYAKDLAGNINYSEVVIEKLEDGITAIFGYNVLLIISLIGLITAIILKRKFN